MKYLFLALLIGCASPAFAANTNANINKGDLEAGGSAFIDYSQFSKFQFDARPSVQYFIADSFSIGGELAVDFNARYSTAAIGPKASYYFWSSEKWTSDLALALYGTRSNNRGRGDDGFSNYFDVTPSASLLYFIVPTVAIGPTLLVDVPINRTAFDGDSLVKTELLGHLSIYF